LKDNIVGAVILISLLIWVPVSCAIHFYDKKAKKESKKSTRRDFRRSFSTGSDGRLPQNRRKFSTRYSRPSIRGNSEEVYPALKRPRVYYPSSYQK